MTFAELAADPLSARIIRDALTERQATLRNALQAARVRGDADHVADLRTHIARAAELLNAHTVDSLDADDLDALASGAF